MIGSVTLGTTIWEVWSDGHAYSNNHDHWKRTKAGTWLPIGSCSAHKSRKDLTEEWITFFEVSDELERIYTNFILKIITEE